MLAKMNVVSLIVVLFMQLLKSDVFADSYKKSFSDKSSLEENHSSNEIPHDELIPNDNQHLYYLPTQTTFGSHLHPSAHGASITSPPHITPASVYKSSDHVFTSTVEQDAFMNDDYVAPYVSQCMSETPSKEKLESVAILSSKKFVPENLVLSGHTEIASKTSSESDASKISEMVSESSVPFQRTHIYMPSASDL